MGFYLGPDVYLGDTIAQTLWRLSTTQRKRICYDYVARGLTSEEAADLVVYSGVPELEEFTKDALNYLKTTAEEFRFSGIFGEVWYKVPADSKPSTSKNRKIPAKTTSKSTYSKTGAKAPARKNTNTSRRY